MRSNGSVIRGNQSNNGDGGGVAASGTATIHFQDATLQHNQAATNGGAVSTDAGVINFTGWLDMRYNHAGGNGGALAISGTANPSIIASGASQPPVCQHCWRQWRRDLPRQQYNFRALCYQRRGAQPEHQQCNR